MKLTPMDIKNKEFKKAIRGYATDEVDEFMEEIVENYEEIFKENSKQKRKRETKISSLFCFHFILLLSFSRLLSVIAEIFYPVTHTVLHIRLELQNSPTALPVFFFLPFFTLLS